MNKAFIEPKLDENKENMQDCAENDFSIRGYGVMISNIPPPGDSQESAGLDSAKKPLEPEPKEPLQTPEKKRKVRMRESEDKLTNLDATAGLEKRRKVDSPQPVGTDQLGF